MAPGDGGMLVMIRHPGIPRCEVADVLCRRWPDAAAADVGSVSPSWRMRITDAIELARARRGVEPLRIIILAQQAHRQQATGRQPVSAEPMPIVL
jgi:hypothetical protein